MNGLGGIFNTLFEIGVLNSLNDIKQNTTLPIEKEMSDKEYSNRAWADFYRRMNNEG